MDVIKVDIYKLWFIGQRIDGQKSFQGTKEVVAGLSINVKFIKYGLNWSLNDPPST